MLYLLGMKDCPRCEESKKLLENAGIEFEVKDLAKPENLELAQKFGIKIAGAYVYDDEVDSVSKVSTYL